MQERLFPSRSALEVITGLRLSGDIDSRAVEAAARSLVKAHAAMRTQVVHRNDTVQQVEHDAHEVDIDIERFPLAALNDQLNQTAIGKFSDIGNTVFQCFGDSEEQVILIRTHHLFTDGWSTAIQVEDFAAAYNMALQGRPVILPHGGSSVREFVEFEQAYLNGEQRTIDERYWTNQMRQAADRKGETLPGGRDFSAGVERIRLPPHQVRGLEAITRIRDLTTLTLLVASVREALRKVGGSTRNNLGLMVNGRNVSLDLARVVGCFINTVPLVLGVEADASIYALENIQRTIDDAIAHSAFPYQCNLRLYRSMTAGIGEPVDVLINYQGSISSINSEINGAQSTVISWEELRPQAQFPLSIQFVPVGEELVITFKYSVRCYTQNWIQRLATEVRQSLDDICAQNDAYCPPSPLIPQTTVTSVHSVADNLIGRFRQCVETHPQRLCLMGGNLELSYSQVDEWSNTLASLLEPQLGTRDGERRVAILMEHTPQYVVAILSVLKAGGTAVLLDPNYPSSYLSSVCADANPRLLMVDSFDTAQHILVPRVLVQDLPSSEALASLVQPQTYAEAVYVIYTSGTTGTPRGVKIGHASLLNLLDGLDQVVYSKCSGVERIGLFGSFAFDTSVKQWLQLFAGRTVDVVPSPIRKNVALLSDYVADRVSAFDCTPSYARLILDRLSLEHPTRAMVMLLGGEPIGKQLWNDIRHSTSVRGWNLYGVTEATVDSAATPIEGEEPFAGSVLPGQEVLILGDDLKPLAHGNFGEICIAGAGVALGYVTPSGADKKFITLPDGRRIFRTGDQGRMDECGRLWVAGRLDRQCKIGGQRIELDGIEQLIKSVEGVREAAVVKSEKTERLVTFLVGQQGQREEIESRILASLRERLPDASVVSEICWLDHMPLTSRGKLDYPALVQSTTVVWVEEKRLDPAAGLDLGPQLRHMLTLWREVLKQPTLGPDADFFEAGGHSLLAIELIHRLEPYDATLSMEVLLEARTPRQLSARLGAKREVVPSSVVLLRDGDDEVPIFCFHVAGGQVLCYDAIARNMPSEYRIYGVQSYTARRGAEEHANCDGMLDHYAHEIVRVYPGPYRLLGWSFGGLLALAVGRRLEEMGYVVEFIGLLDTYFSKPIYQTKPTSYNPLQEYYYLFSQASIAKLATLTPNEQMHIADDLHSMNAEQRIRWAMSSGLSIPDVPIGDLLHHEELARKHRALIADHKLLPVRAAVRLWRTKSSEVTADWPTFAANYGQFDSLGDHYSMMQGTHAQSLARSIADVLKSIENQNQPEWVEVVL